MATKRSWILATLVAAAFAVVPCVANALFVLDFEGLGNLEPIDDFYNGGLGGNGSGPGPSFGVTFLSTALALIDADAGGTGNFGGEPSPSTIMFWLQGTDAIMNVSAGFDTGFSFYYTAIQHTGFVNVWDGLDGTGSLLGSFALPLTPFNGAPDPNGQFSPLVPIGVAFAGTARSVEFGGVPDQIGFDNITFGSPSPQPPVPEPASILLFGLGLVGLAAARARRRK